MFIINYLVGLIIFYVLPTFLICFLIKKIVKRKLALGWCWLIFFVCVLVTVILATLFLIANDISYNGRLIGVIEMAVIFGIVKSMLYGENIPSIFDTEKELKIKRGKVKQETLNSKIKEQKPHKLMIDSIRRYMSTYQSKPLDIVANEIIDYIKKHEKEIDDNKAYYDENNLVNQVAIRQATVLLLTDTLDNKLISGDFHIYRGKLDGAGKELLAIYKRLLKKFIEFEMVDDDTKKPIDNIWIENQFKNLCEDIKMVG